MIMEHFDEESGAILFKKDSESKKLESAIRDIRELSMSIVLLTHEVEELKKIVDKLAPKQ